MVATQTSPDFDAYERDLAEFFDAGKKQGATKLERKKVANRSRSLDLREEQQAAQRRREAQRDAASQVPTVTRQRSTETSRPTPAPALSAPTFSSGSTSTGTGNLDRATTARIIVVIVALSAIGTVAHDAIVGPAPSAPVKVGNGTVNPPTHLRTLGAVLVMGTVALIVNELDPGVGLILGLGIAFDVGANTLLGTNGLFARLQGGMFGKTVSVPQTSVVPPSGTVPTPFGYNIPGPAGVSFGQNQVWNGKAWVPVTSTKTN